MRVFEGIQFDYLVKIVHVFVTNTEISIIVLQKMKKHQLGKTAERIACDYFEKLGFEVAEMNYRHRRSEIDLIVLNNGLLIFVEVKYRSSNKFGNPEDFVTDNQIRSILKAADEYVHSINWNKNIRFDIISINRKGELMHFEDAFY